MSLSTHVLDTSIGGPVPELPVRLEVRTGDGWRPVADDHTDEDGRIGDLAVNAGVYRLVFDTSDYGGFYPEITVVFRVSSAGEHYHVPLLLSPFGYTTYRGS
jgi:5-hydroxyisourate hydrolase